MLGLRPPAIRAPAIGGPRTPGAHSDVEELRTVETVEEESARRVYSDGSLFRAGSGTLAPGHRRRDGWSPRPLAELLLPVPGRSLQTGNGAHASPSHASLFP